MSARIKTGYPGVFYRETKRIGSNGTERVYYIVFKKNGKVHEEKVGRQYADDMTPARAASIRAERIEGKRLSRKEIRKREEEKRRAEADRWTIDRLWWEYRSQKEDSKSIRTDENRFMNYIKPKFENKEPRDIIQLDVDRLRINMMKNLKPQTVKHVLALLKRIVNFGVNKGLCSGMNFKIQMPLVNNLKTEDLTPEQLGSLIDAINQDDNLQAANFMRLALFTGMRRGELFKLKWEHIDFERGFIDIKDPKGGQDQKISLNEGSRKVLQSHIRTESPYVFPGRGGRQRVDINHQVNRIKDRAGLPRDFRPLHGLRHAYASMLASTGKVDMYTLQKLLTHKDPRMTQRYAHLRDEALKQAADLAGSIIEEAVAGKTDKVINMNGQKNGNE